VSRRLLFSLARASKSCGTLGSWLSSRACCLSFGPDLSDHLPWPSSPIPLHRPCRASTPARIAARFGPRRSLSANRVPSSWFRTTPMASSARRSRACCIPLPVMRSAAFRVCTLPATPFTPSEDSPRQQPLHVSVAVAPLPFVGSEALLRCRVWYASRPLPVARCPVLPWASFPFEVLLRTGGTRALDSSARSRPASSAPSPAHALAQRGPGAASLRRRSRG